MGLSQRILTLVSPPCFPRAALDLQKDAIPRVKQRSPFTEVFFEGDEILLGDCILRVRKARGFSQQLLTFRPYHHDFGDDYSLVQTLFPVFLGLRWRRTT